MTLATSRTSIRRIVRDQLETERPERKGLSPAMMPSGIIAGAFIERFRERRQTAKGDEPS